MVKSYYSTSDQIRSEEHYVFLDADWKAMTANGLKTKWYENGQLHTKQHFIKGSRTGQLESFWPNGLPKRVETYQDNEAVKSVCYTENKKEKSVLHLKKHHHFQEELVKCMSF